MWCVYIVSLIKTSLGSLQALLTCKIVVGQMIVGLMSVGKMVLRQWV